MRKDALSTSLSQRSITTAMALAITTIIGCGTNPPPVARGSERAMARGTVHGPQGTPVQAAIVFTSLAEGSIAATVDAGADGSFSADVPPGDYALTATSSDGFVWLEKVSIGDAPLEVPLSADCARLSGTVHGPSVSSAAAFVQLTRLSDKTGDRFAVRIDRAGMFSACLPQAEYAVGVAGDIVSIPVLARAPGPRVDIRAVARTQIEERTDAAQPDDDVRPFLERIVSNATVIGIGEANHGTRDFLRTRLHVSMELAKRHGFRTIALEAGFAEVIALDRYIHGDSIDVSSSVQRLGYWMWDTTDFLEVLDELRAYNDASAESEKISIIGVDVQDSGAASELLRSSKPLNVTPAEHRVLVKFGADAHAAKSLKDEDLAALNAVIERAKAFGDNDAELALAALALAHRLEMVTTDFVNGLRKRDAGIADMLISYQRLHRDAGIAFWAHNAHVAREADETFESAGQHLDRFLGTRYVSIALLSGAGEARAWDAPAKIGVIPHTLPPPLTWSFEQAVLSKTTADVAYVAFCLAPPAFTRWLELPRYVREFGARYAGRSSWTLRNMLRAFDGAIVIRATSVSTPTPTGVRRAK